jgi:hydrophobic/amphiphilic exporter-1 (mainly G- bacteria), HAE1 family
MGGITGRLYQQFAITIAVSVVFSSINALSLSPALCSLLLKKPVPYKGLLGKFFSWFNKKFDRSTKSYTNFTSIFVKKTTRGIIYILIVGIAIVVTTRFVPGGFLPEEDQGYIFINAQLPDAASLQRTDEVAREIEKVLSNTKEIDYYTNITGYSLISGAFTTNSDFIFVSLKDWGERDLTALQIARKLNMQFMKIVGGQIFAFGPPAIPGLGNGSGFTFMLQDKKGNSPQYLAQEAQKFIAEVAKRPEIGNVYTSFRANVPQKYIDIDKDKALKAGISLNDLYNTIGAFLGGAYVNDFNRFGRLYKAYVMAEPSFRQKPEQLDLFFVKNNKGNSVPISSFLTVRDIFGPDGTYRYNLYRSAEISGSPASGYSSAQALNALEEVAKEELPDGMGYEWSNMSYQEKEAAGAGSVIFLFSLLFVFLILAAQYESWSLPFSILLGTPFALFGAFLFIMIARFFSETYLNNIFVQISLVMLIAMAAKNAILIVEFAKMKFDEGMSLFDAAVAGAQLRFRPILMTAFSFILGVLPLIFASGAGAESRKVMGMALLGGMSVATFLGVFFYPLLFIFIGKIAAYEKNRDLLQNPKQ